ncbi:MAG TPA: hypothetical protein PL063_02760 [Candidatus Cloacimonadota bacterium]|jgi:hypothetical protein|nr:hypothetical protein [Candidatus Cloacimonadota bacterium]HQB40782.1 hypothetical protein [Candidatus Cloacimonadota bacterium]
MKPIITFKDNHLGEIHIVIPKIREVTRGLGSVVITYDNGDKRNIDTKNQTELLNEITNAISDYYNDLK